MPSLNITKESVPSPGGAQLTVVQFQGVIDEGVDLITSVGATFRDLRLDFGGIDRVNSVGVRSLRVFIEDLVKSGKQVTLLRVAVSMMPILGQFLGGLSGVRVESVQAPFLCKVCKNGFDETVLISSLEAITSAVSGAPCKKCGGQGEFDDVPADYFHDALKYRN
jgi:hypothetical protein